MKLLFLVSEDWYFVSHRLPLAIAAKDAGYEVAIVTRVSTCEEVIKSAGLRVIPLRLLKRSSLNPLKELMAILELLFIYRRERPDIVHQVALKPVVYGSIAVRFAGKPKVVNALAGLGFVFSSQKRLARLVRLVLVRLLRLLLNNRQGRVIVQNTDDMMMLSRNGIVDPRHMRLIRGAGVDLASYIVRPLADGVPIAMLASRMLWDKGVAEFVAAARQLKMQGLQARFVLVGDSDMENPTSIPRQQLTEWQAEGVVEWWGYRNDMPDVLAQAHVVCLPTFYGEGIPKVLIEAMACARPIITTDISGCRELVRHGENGYLIKPKDVDGLSSALADLLTNRAVRERMGALCRKIAESEFSVQMVVAETLKVYRELLSNEND